MTQSYIYLEDRLTDEALKGQRCTAVRRTDSKCIRGKNGSMVVEFMQSVKVIGPAIAT